jgi:sugar lactone lactonase YvrE
VDVSAAIEACGSMERRAPPGMELAPRKSLAHQSTRDVPDPSSRTMNRSISASDAVFEGRARLGEGPVWDDRTGSLFWLDILNRRVHRFFPDGREPSVYDVGDIVGSVALTGDETLLIALRHGLARLDLRSGEVEPLIDVEAGKDENKLNDGKPDARGRFWFGSFSQEDGEAALYRYDPDGALHVMQDGMTGSNGLGWSPDGGTFYLTDSGDKVIYAFRFDESGGEISDRRVFVDLSDSDATPDGLCVDAEGHVWSAQFDGGAVLRFSPAGEQVLRLEVPAPRTTSCAFGGEGLQDLYITTASVGLEEDVVDRFVHSGDLFRFRPGVRGLPFHRYG